MPRARGSGGCKRRAMPPSEMPAKALKKCEIREVSLKSFSFNSLQPNFKFYFNFVPQSSLRIPLWPHTSPAAPARRGASTAL